MSRHRIGVATPYLPRSASEVRLAASVKRGPANAVGSRRYLKKAVAKHQSPKLFLAHCGSANSARPGLSYFSFMNAGSGSYCSRLLEAMVSQSMLSDVLLRRDS